MEWESDELSALRTVWVIAGLSYEFGQCFAMARFRLTESYPELREGHDLRAFWNTCRRLLAPPVAADIKYRSSFLFWMRKHAKDLYSHLVIGGVSAWETIPYAGPSVAEMEAVAAGRQEAMTPRSGVAGGLVSEEELERDTEPATVRIAGKSYPQGARRPAKA